MILLLACATPTLDVEAAAVVDPATCEVPTMQEQFPTVPNPYGEWEAADACVATEHDAILILGCPSNTDGTASECQQARVDIALALREEGLGRRFVTTGGAVANDYVEADALKQLLVDAGVDEADVYTDPLAEHTDENLYYGSVILAEHGWNDAIVVSEDPGQLVYTAVSDANCCVGLGRLSIFAFSLGAGDTSQVLGHYALYPSADEVTDEECAHIAELYMSSTLEDRRACADDFQLR